MMMLEKKKARPTTSWLPSLELPSRHFFQHRAPQSPGWVSGDDDENDEEKLWKIHLTTARTQSRRIYLASASTVARKKKKLKQDSYRRPTSRCWPYFCGVGWRLGDPMCRLPMIHEPSATHRCGSIWVTTVIKSLFNKTFIYWTT